MGLSFWLKNRFIRAFFCVKLNTCEQEIVPGNYIMALIMANLMATLNTNLVMQQSTDCTKFNKNYITQG